MEPRYCKALLVETKGQDGEQKIYRFRATTETQDRQREVVTVDGWETNAFLKNPVFMLAHRYDAMPIGKVVSLETDKDGLIADVVFDEQDETARMVQSKYERGFLNAVSVGFNPIEMDYGKRDEPVKHTKKELLEISAVAVPANPDALMLRSLLAQFGQHPSTSAIEGKAEGLSDAIWSSVAGGMLALMTAEDVADDARRRAFNLLERLYQLCGKESPEYRAREEIRALGPDEIKGLFWEGEMDIETKAGRRNSKADMDKMRALMGKMQSMRDDMDGMMGMMGDLMDGDMMNDEEGDKSANLEFDIDLSAFEAMVKKEV